jgi:hypothetical protein
MPKSHTIAPARRAKGAVAVAATGALVLSGLALGGAAATADSSSTVVYAPAIGLETDAGYPKAPWFFGQNANQPTTANVTDGSLVLPGGAQFLHQFAGISTVNETAGALDEFIASDPGFTVADGTDGTASFQLAMIVGPDKTWTTLRTATDYGAGSDSANVSDIDQWESSSNVGDVIKKNTPYSLDELVADIDAVGAQQLFAFGIEATVATGETDVVSISGAGENYTFAPDVTVPAAASHVVVETGALGLETPASYPSNPWFFGNNADATPSGSIVNGSLALTSTPTEGTQLLHQFTDATRPASLRAFIEAGANFTLATADTGSASFQLPLVYGPTGSTHFTTLRTASDLAAGSHDVRYGDQWTSSHDIGTAITANGSYTLAEIVNAIEAAGGSQYIYGFGVQVTAGTIAQLASIQAEGVKYTFADTKKLTFISLTIAGSVKVGQTLTATPSISSPNGATLTYQWLRNGAAISHATKSTYAVSTSDYKQKLSVKVTATKHGYTSASRTSAATAAVGAGTIGITTGASITGTTAVGSKLTAHITTAPTATNSYQWRANDVAIKNATASTYTLSAGELGKQISVVIKAAKTDYTTITSTSAESAAVGTGTLTLGVPTLAGSTKVGKSLTAKVTSTSGALLRYSFYSDGTLVQLSTSPVLVLTWDLVGTHITVSVAGSKPGYVSLTSATSTASAAVS